jgi:hypothetical protein
MLCVAHWQAKVKVLAVSLIDLHVESSGIGVCEFACMHVALYQIVILLTGLLHKPSVILVNAVQISALFCFLI